MRIGVLALQGAFAEHTDRLSRLGNDVFEIRSLNDIKRPFDALVLTGGESTAIKKLLRTTGLFYPLKNFITEGMPVFGTCAGLILLSKNVIGGTPCFSTMDIEVKRNAYGRQLGSFRCTDNFDGIPVEMPFIRAPYVTKVGKDVKVLASHDNKIVAVKQKNQLATAFHPELTNDDTVYKTFMKMI